MCKFSIIVPVFNTEKYLDRCLNSLLNQTFDDYEIIIINDGSYDDSVNIIKKYLPNPKIKFINQENSGVAEARNVGILVSQGDYFLFVDSDDYISKNLLSSVNSILKDDYDLIKIQYEISYENKNIDMSDIIQLNKEYSGESFFMEILNTHRTFELLWSFVYKKKYFIDNNFKFQKGTYHEDFGILPYIILKAKKIYEHSGVMYYYFQSENSIMRSKDYQKTLKKAYDMILHFDYLYENVNKLDLDVKTRKYFNSYIANGVIDKINLLNKDDRGKYIRKLKERKIFDLVLDDTLIRKIKKLILKIKY